MTTENQQRKDPAIVNRPYLTKKKFLGKEKPVEALNEYVVQLMRNTGFTETIENVQPGEFNIASKDGKSKKVIYLIPSKITTFTYNGTYAKGWVCHEDNAFPYPQDPVLGSEMIRKVIEKISMNYRDANEAAYLTAKTKMWIWIILGSIVGIYILYLLLKSAGIVGGETQILQTAVQNASTVANVTGVAING